MILTPARKRLLAHRLGQGQTVVDVAAAAGCTRQTLAGWIAKGAARHARYLPLARAVVAGQEALRRRELALVEHAASLLEAGQTIRGAAKALGVTYEVLRVLVRRGQRGNPETTALAQAAGRRARAPWHQRPRCEHCGAPLRANATKAA